MLAEEDTHEERVIGQLDDLVKEVASELLFQGLASCNDLGWNSWQRLSNHYSLLLLLYLHLFLNLELWLW